MGKIYGVGLITRDQMRDITLESIFSDSDVDGDVYIHKGDFLYIFTLNNILSTEISNQTLVYKTLAGAKRLKNRFNGDWEMKLRYSLRDANGRYVKSMKSSPLHEVVIIDITESWDSLIDERIAKRKKTYENDIKRLLSKKSKQ